MQKYISWLIVSVAGVVVLRRHRLLVLAFLFYIVSTFFLWRFDAFDVTVVGDRFMYIPSIGFCLLLGWAMAEGWGRVRVCQKWTQVFYCALIGLIFFSLVCDGAGDLGLAMAEDSVLPCR